MSADVAEAYVGRLRHRGVVALGFGTEVVRAGTPATLVDACDALGLPLFEVPYETSFIAVAQANADAVSREANARNAWALAAQRAISLAAMRPDGLGATIAELSRQLDGWVGLFDLTGRLDRGFPDRAVPDADLDVLRSETLRLLRRGSGRASRSPPSTAPGTRSRRSAAAGTSPGCWRSRTVGRSTGRGARSSPPSSPSRGWPCSRTASSPGPAGSCAPGS